jgi:hypothetical protein
VHDLVSVVGSNQIFGVGEEGLAPSQMVF